MDRRRVLALGGTVGAVGLGGCATIRSLVSGPIRVFDTERYWKPTRNGDGGVWYVSGKAENVSGSRRDVTLSIEFLGESKDDVTIDVWTVSMAPGRVEPFGRSSPVVESRAEYREYNVLVDTS